MRRTQGFTLIELMIVVAIIAIIAAIAIPNLIRSRMASFEASAISNLRTIHSSQSAYKLANNLDANANGVGEYGLLLNLSAGVSPYVDISLGTGTRSGYLYAIELTGNSTTDESMWAASAWPIRYSGTGIRTFYIDESGALRGSDSGGGQVLRAAALGMPFPVVSP